MPSRKRHLVLRDSRAACGLSNPQFRTVFPADVTCKACHKSVQMHDALVGQQFRR